MDVAGRHDVAAGWQARLAYERAQQRALKKASYKAVFKEARRAFVATVHLTATRSTIKQRAPSATTSRTPSETGVAGRWRLSWWTTFSMLLAWVGSVPLTVAMYADRGDTPTWVTHWLLGLPTVLSALGLGWFLVRVPPERPMVRKLFAAVALAPLFLIAGMLVFLFTLGLGAVAFAWLLWWQERSLSSARGEDR